MRFSFEERALLYTELAKLSAAGFPVSEAIDTVADTHPPEATMTLLMAAKSGLAAKLSIGEAFASSDEVPLSDLEVSIISSSERGGVLGDGFQHLADYFRMRETTAKQMRRKMIYPLVLVHVALLIPIAPLMLNSPSPGRVLLMSVMALLAIYLLLFGAISLGRRLASKAETDAAADRMLARLPLVGAVRQNLSLARFTSVYRMHLLAGERIDESLRSSAAASRSGQIVEIIDGQAIPGVRDGQPVGPVLAEHPKVFTSAFGRAFVTAEHSGSLDRDLLRWSERFQDSARSSMEKLGNRAPKIFYAVAAGIAVWQIFRLFSLYFGLIDKAIDQYNL